MFEWDEYLGWYLECFIERQHRIIKVYLIDLESGYARTYLNAVDYLYMKSLATYKSN